MTSVAVAANPFYQPAVLWQLRVYVMREHMPAVEEAFGDLALSISSFEIDEAQQRWYVEIITGNPPEDSEIASRLALVSGLLGIATPHCDAAMLNARDWVHEVEKTFAPLVVGRFFVHGSHVNDVPFGRIALKVNAGAAFGSGEHATTSGCLFALNELTRRRRFLRPLDMGCGSGILAIAMAKLWNVQVDAVDIDPVSVRVARVNALENSVQHQVRFAAGNGYHTPLVRGGALYDLIVANILARPLVRMAPQLANHLVPGGIAVLSGLLDFQERFVLAAHRAQGLTLWRRIALRGWHTLILRKAF